MHGYTHLPNKSMQLQIINIPLLNDNTGHPGHPKDSKTKNIKVVYLKKNTTSELQP